MSEALRIGIVGPRGRMGQALLAVAEQDPHVMPVAIVRSGESGGQTLDDALRLDALIDFTRRDTVQPHAAWVVARRVPWVLGTTGLQPPDIAAVQAAAQATLVFQASNFSLGVALLTDLAARAARVLGLDADVEIVEAHHHHKQDAPSGTALSVGRAIAAARGQDFEAVRRDGRSGLVGERPRGEIGMHAVRLADVVGEHEVSFGWPFERLKLAHDARDRRVFARGALRAAKFCATRGGTGLVGMPELLASS